jgi:hypothetical protein
MAKRPKYGSPPTRTVAIEGTDHDAVEGDSATVIPMRRGGARSIQGVSPNLRRPPRTEIDLADRMSGIPDPPWTPPTKPGGDGAA